MPAAGLRRRLFLIHGLAQGFDYCEDDTAFVDRNLKPVFAKLDELGYASSREERAGQEGKDSKGMAELDETYNQAMTLAR